MTQRLNSVFASGKKVFVAYMMGGDPDRDASQELLAALPDAGVDIIELGVPFTDPMADGPTIEESGIRARKGGATLASVLDMAVKFRKANTTTPIILMGYYNPVHHMGDAAFAKAASEAGVDGAIIVDVPPEEDGPLQEAFAPFDLALIRLATPTTDAARLPKVVRGTKGFVYYVSMTGVTGAGLSESTGDNISSQVAAVKTASNLPVVVGFGVKTPERAREIAGYADGVVVGSAIVKSFHESGHDATIELVKSLADAVHGQ